MKLRREMWFGVGVVSFLMIVAALVGRGGWPGDVSSCLATNGCYCETLRGGTVQQPANTWSAFAFALVGLGVLSQIGNDRQGGGRRRNRLTSSPTYASIFGATALFLFVGAAASHASVTGWAGQLDSLAIAAFIAFPLCYQATRGRSARWFLSLYSVAVCLTTLVLVTVDSSKAVFLILALLAISTDAVVGRSQPLRRWPFYWLSLVTLALGYGTWWLGQTERSACHGSSLFQWHAVWHVLAAVVVLLVYLYLATQDEEPTKRSTSAPPHE